MQILFTADLHMNLSQLRWLETHAESADLIVIAGDLLQLAHSTGKEEQISEVVPLLKRISQKRPLLLCSGNHDGNDHNPKGEETATWIETLATEHPPPATFDKGNYRFTSCPWWNGPETRAAMLARLEAQEPKFGRPWTWLHHAPPRGSKTAWTRKGDVGDPYLLKLIGRFKPSYILSGHVHNAPFYAEGSWREKIGKTWVFNPGMQPGEVPAHIRIDLESQTARYSSLEGISMQELS